MASNNRPNLFGFKTFCLVTGGSKGLGRCIAVRFASTLPKGSVVLLLARSSDQLLKTKALIEESTPGILMKVIPMDLTNAENADFEHCLRSTLSEFRVSAASFEQALIVHNAASMGDVSKKVVNILDKKMLQDYFSLNLTSMILLNNIFLKIFNEKAVDSRVVVHISSICALQPFKTWATYCSGERTGGVSTISSRGRARAKFVGIGNNFKRRLCWQFHLYWARASVGQNFHQTSGLTRRRKCLFSVVES